MNGAGVNGTLQKKFTHFLNKFFKSWGKVDIMITCKKNGNWASLLVNGAGVDCVHLCQLSQSISVAGMKDSNFIHCPHSNKM